MLGGAAKARGAAERGACGRVGLPGRGEQRGARRRCGARGDRGHARRWGTQRGRVAAVVEAWGGCEVHRGRWEARGAGRGRAGGGCAAVVGGGMGRRGVRCCGGGAVGARGGRARQRGVAAVGVDAWGAAEVRARRRGTRGGRARGSQRARRPSAQRWARGDGRVAAGCAAAVVEARRPARERARGEGDVVSIGNFFLTRFRLEI
ncbi:uncharacterized protein [Miscanthus floridulus]|uniref:uncharacterized protein n=1 Tax=Miscanthus floridulus TaxID=154761 RepID=UPI00345A5CD2